MNNIYKYWPFLLLIIWIIIALMSWKKRNVIKTNEEFITAIRKSSWIAIFGVFFMLLSLFFLKDDPKFMYALILWLFSIGSYTYCRNISVNDYVKRTSPNDYLKYMATNPNKENRFFRVVKFLFIDSAVSTTLVTFFAQDFLETYLKVRFTSDELNTFIGFLQMGKESLARVGSIIISIVLAILLGLLTKFNSLRDAEKIFIDLKKQHLADDAKKITSPSLL